MSGENKVLKKKKVLAIPVLPRQPRKVVRTHHWYIAELIDVEERKGIYGSYARFVFELKNGKYDTEKEESAKGHKVACIADIEAIRPGNNVWEIVKGLSGKEPEIDGPNIDVTKYIGKSYKIFIQVEEGKDEELNEKIDIKKIQRYKKVKSKK